eukprot:COSAG06_NODE_2419_length_6906_cov_2.885118_4_plen_212_part_00
MRSTIKGFGSSASRASSNASEFTPASAARARRSFIVIAFSSTRSCSRSGPLLLKDCHSAWQHRRSAVCQPARKLLQHGYSYLYRTAQRMRLVRASPLSSFVPAQPHRRGMCVHLSSSHGCRPAPTQLARPWSPSLELPGCRASPPAQEQGQEQEQEQQKQQAPQAPQPLAQQMEPQRPPRREREPSGRSAPHRWGPSASTSGTARRPLPRR